MPSHRSVLDLWYAALAEPMGIYITSPDPIRLKNFLYAARARHQREASPDPTVRVPTPIDTIQIRTAPDAPRERLWLVNVRGEPQ